MHSARIKLLLAQERRWISCSQTETLSGNDRSSYFPEMQAAYRAIATAGGEMDSVDASKFRVLNMLNTKYFILPAGQGQTVPIENPYAYGNAWFVNNVSTWTMPTRKLMP